MYAWERTAVPEIAESRLFVDTKVGVLKGDACMERGAKIVLGDADQLHLLPELYGAFLSFVYLNLSTALSVGRLTTCVVFGYLTSPRANQRKETRFLFYCFIFCFFFFIDLKKRKYHWFVTPEYCVANYRPLFVTDTFHLLVCQRPWTRTDKFQRCFLSQK